MKEEDLSLIKRYPIVEYLERKGIKPVRRTAAYALYYSPLREETHPSFKVDTEKNLWIDYGEGRGGSIIDLCMRLDGCTLSEAICRLGQNASENITYNSCKDFVPNNLQPAVAANEARRLIEISDTLPPHLQEYLARPTCVFEGFMDFLSFLSMKEEVTSACLVLNSVSNSAKAIRYMNAQGISSILTFLDNDDAGRRAVQDFIKAGFHVEDMNIHYKDFKDLNDFHVSRVRERQKHKGQIQAHMSVTDQNQNKESKQVKHKIR